MSVRVPPQALEAEASLLGSLMLDHEALDNLPHVMPEMFYREDHRIIFRAILSLAEAGVPADLVALTRHLATTRQLDRVGGAAFLTGLMEGTPISAYANHYAELVIEAHRAREVIRVAGAIMQGAYDGRPVDELLAEHERNLTTLARFDNIERGPAEFIQDAMDLISGVGGLSTGLIDLDRVTGGIVKGGYNVIAARPSMGKSATLRAILQHRVEQGDRVALFSVDQSGGEIYALTAAARSRTSLTSVRPDKSGHRSSRQAEALEKLTAELPGIAHDWDQRLVIYDTLSDATRILQAARREIRAGATVIAVDHLQSLSLEGRTDDTAAVSNISRMFKALSREFNVTVILLSQLGRDVENNPGKRPTLRNLRQSGAIEEDANQVLMLYREEYYERLERPDRTPDRAGELDVIVAKNKLGSVPHTVTLTWVGKTATVQNRALPHHEVPYAN